MEKENHKNLLKIIKYCRLMFMEICIFKKIFTTHLSTNKKMNTNKFFRKIHLKAKRNI